MPSFSPTRPQISTLYRLIDVLSRAGATILRWIWPDLTKAKQLIRLTLLRIKLPHLPLGTQIDGPIDIIGSGKIYMGKACRFSRHVELGTELSGKITLGDRIRINRGTTLFSYADIKIGDDSLIGEFVTIRDANHGIETGQKIREQAHHSTPIQIGSDVWIGRGSVILPGVTIGDHAVIGANSVVTHSIDANSIAVGSPAKVIKKRS